MTVEADIEELDKAITSLRHAFEQYFMGLERLPPSKEHEALRARLRQIATVQINNTATRFRRNNLVARFHSMDQYWVRLLRQIEEGTFKRDRLRAEKLLATPGQPGAPEAGAAAGEESSAPAAPLPAPPLASSASAPSAAYKPVYDAYLRARANCGLSGSISYDQLAATLATQAQAIKAKFNCQAVVFKVGVEGGKPVIKAVPRTQGAPARAAPTRANAAPASTAGTPSNSGATSGGTAPPPPRRPAASQPPPAAPASGPTQIATALPRPGPPPRRDGAS